MLSWSSWSVKSKERVQATNKSLASDFAVACSAWLSKVGLDGFDIDWEFPAGAAEKDGLSFLLQQLRAHFDAAPRPLLLSAAVANAAIIIRGGYDVPSLNRSLHFLNLMNYDFHTWHLYTPFVGFNAPLHPLPAELWPLSSVNAAWATKEWLRLGMAPSKILMGVPSYGRAFRLLSSSLHFPYAPSTGYQEPQFRTYAQVCRLIQSGDFTKAWSQAAEVPYLYGNRTWVTYDDERSLKAKVRQASYHNDRSHFLCRFRSTGQ